MALNIKNAEVERMVDELARLTGDSKTQAVRQAVEERLRRVMTRTASGDRALRARRFLEREVWPLVPPAEVGRRLTTAQEDAILGYGPEGM